MDDIKELNNIIARNKLYAIIEFFYTQEEKIIKNVHIPYGKEHDIIHGIAYIYILQTLYTIYEGLGVEYISQGMPEPYAKLISIEQSLILLYDKKNMGVLDELYNLTIALLGDIKEYTFMELVNNKEDYDKYKEIAMPRLNWLKQHKT